MLHGFVYSATGSYSAFSSTFIQSLFSFNFYMKNFSYSLMTGLWVITDRSTVNFNLTKRKQTAYCSFNYGKNREMWLVLDLE